MQIDGNTSLLGLIGNPIAHSYSPYLHNAVLQYMGINAVYVPLLTNADSLPAAVHAIRAFNFKGVNVTIPYKEAVIPYLDALDGEAARCGSVNVIAYENNQLVGYNTDGEGYLISLKEAGVPFAGMAVLIGAGGAARSVSFALARAGFNEIELLDTNLNKASNLAQDLQKHTSSQINSGIMNEESFCRAAARASLVVNCSPVGMHPLVENSPVSNLDVLSQQSVLSDLIYNPLMTRFLAQGKERGLKVVGGLPMFIHQAALTLKLVLGIDPPVQFMKEVMANEVQ